MSKVKVAGVVILLIKYLVAAPVGHTAEGWAPLTPVLQVLGTQVRQQSDYSVTLKVLSDLVALK